MREEELNAEIVAAVADANTKMQKVEEKERELGMMRRQIVEYENASSRLDLANRRIKDLENLVQIQQQEKKKEREKDSEVAKICAQLHAKLQTVQTSSNFPH